MNRLDYGTIADLAKRFVIQTTDEAKQAIVDQLGNHPVNHAAFINRLAVLCDGPTDITYMYAYQDYITLTRSL